MVKVTPNYESANTVYPTNAEYLIDYQYEGKKYRSVYIATLCVGFKGGTTHCSPPAKNGNTVSIKLDDNLVINSVIVFNKPLKAEVLKVVNVDHE